MALRHLRVIVLLQFLIEVSCKITLLKITDGIDLLPQDSLISGTVNLNMEINKIYEDVPYRGLAWSAR